MTTRSTQADQIRSLLGGRDRHGERHFLKNGAARERQRGDPSARFDQREHRPVTAKSTRADQIRSPLGGRDRHGERHFLKNGAARERQRGDPARSVRSTRAPSGDDEKHPSRSDSITAGWSRPPRRTTLSEKRCRSRASARRPERSVRSTRAPGGDDEKHPSRSDSITAGWSRPPRRTTLSEKRCRSRASARRPERSVRSTRAPAGDREKHPSRSDSITAGWSRPPRRTTLSEKRCRLRASARRPRALDSINASTSG